MRTRAGMAPAESIAMRSEACRALRIKKTIEAYFYRKHLLCVKVAIELAGLARWCAGVRSFEIEGITKLI